MIDDDGPRGIALVRTPFLAGDYLELLAVAADARGRGLGARLLAHVEDTVFARARNLFVCVSDFNRPARRFYRSRGYLRAGRLDDLLIAGSAEILLRKTTGPQRARSVAEQPQASGERDAHRREPDRPADEHRVRHQRDPDHHRRDELHLAAVAVRDEADPAEHEAEHERRRVEVEHAATLAWRAR